MVLFGITEIQGSYYLNKFSCHFHSRLSFLFTIGDVQLSIKNDYLHSCLWRKKSTERTCWRVGGKAGSWTWVCSLQETISVTEILGAWAFSLSLPLPFPFPSPSAPTTNPLYKIIFLKKSLLSTDYYYFSYLLQRPSSSLAIIFSNVETQSPKRLISYGFVTILIPAIMEF